ncbi:MAG: hypothetical protein QOH15_3144 [Gaiellales bacterium]|nr:hypothetical protein [Gaiellales bacterium]
MTGKADFTEAEWDTVLHGPTTAGMIVLTAQRGGTFRETFAITRSYLEARKQPGQSELVDEIVSAKPALDHTRYHSPEELKEAGLRHLTEAIDLLQQKATSAEVDAYRAFVISLAEHVANAHREHGVNVSDAEQAALDQVKSAIGASG